VGEGGVVVGGRSVVVGVVEGVVAGEAAVIPGGGGVVVGRASSRGGRGVFVSGVGGSGSVVVDIVVGE